MPAQDQGNFDIKHLDLLRKLLTSQDAYIINLQGDNWAAKLTIQRGSFDQDDTCISTLKHAMEKPITHFSWDRTSTSITMPLDAQTALRRAVADFSLDKVRPVYLQTILSRLPPVRLKPTIIFRLNAEDFRQYQLLYQMGLADNGASIREFLNVPDRELLIQRLKIIIVCYCLSLFQSVEAKKKEVVKEMTVAERIMQRLRGL